MENYPTIQNLVQQIKELCSPIKIILFSRKSNLNNELTSFKICVIVDDAEDVGKLEVKLYLKLESDNPFDVLVYKNTEWCDLIEDKSSFAGQISMSGMVLYEQKNK